MDGKLLGTEMFIFVGCLQAFVIAMHICPMLPHEIINFK